MLLQYKLYENSLNDIYNIKKTVLLNRGIEDIDKYLNLTDNELYHWSLLNNIDEAIKCLLKHIEMNNNIHIIVDSDCDGYTSASILYQYLKLLKPDIKLTYSIHTKKQHGLSDDIQIPENINLLIIPDAGTNDTEQCKQLKEKGIDIIILDHHIQDKENPYAIIVNNQICDYPNKNLSGVGIVYKFLQALDEETWNNYANCFLDLVALGLIGDSMDIREYETRRLINKGLKRINNKLFKALIEKQSYSIGNNINITNIQFYIVPLINGLIRTGDFDEKDMLFRAFIQTDERFKYKPRRKSKDDSEPEEIEEDIYIRVARLSSNAKSRQNTFKDKSIEELSQIIENKGLDKNKIIFVNVTDILNENLTGVVAIKVADKYKKPCLLLRKNKDDDLYSGSGRNINSSPISDLKSFLESLNLFEYITGHSNAFGVGIKANNIKIAIEQINQKLKDVDFSRYYIVDFILNNNELDVRFVKEMADLKDLYGQGINEALIAIENITVNKKM